MITHNSKAFRTILDISVRLWYVGKLMELVSLATVKKAPANSMVQLGKYFQYLIALLDNN